MKNYEVTVPDFPSDKFTTKQIVVETYDGSFLKNRYLLNPAPHIKTCQFPIPDEFEFNNELLDPNKFTVTCIFRGLKEGTKFGIEESEQHVKLQPVEVLDKKVISV